MSQRILIVDDSEKSRLLLKQILKSNENNDYEIYMAEDSFAAMEHLDKFDFDLLMLDINMPFKDGFSTLKTLKDTIRFKMIPVAIITGRNSERDVKKAITLGASTYIIKPFKREDVLGKVDKILNKEHDQKLSYSFDIVNSSPFSEASLEVATDMQIIHVSDSSIVALSPVKPSPEASISLNSPIFSNLNLPQPRVKVNDVSMDKATGLYKIRFVYIGQKPDQVQKLRNWLLVQAANKRKQA